MLLWGLFDPRAFFLLLIGLAFAIYAQYRVQSAYGKYARVRTRYGITAAEAAEELLARAGVSGVRIEQARGFLGDHYDPRTRTLRLSRPASAAVADVGVAAHEAGHAIQHARGYLPLALRSAVVPVASLGSQLAFPIFFLGLIFHAPVLLNIGIYLFAAVVAFTVITLPVEIDASRRAVQALARTGILDREELGAVKEVLTAAALTYVAAAAMAALQLLSMLLVANRRR
ncbi:MAG TPA: zinc metallopeptidase [Candidatus Acetothermia bacterium]|nr:zinc metallopeptidase [Candidatus Acetothermia bacterium]